jgi:maltose O-acetyltransferase
LAASVLVPSHQRWRLLRVLGIDADPCEIRPRFLMGGRNIRIGRDSILNYGVFLDNAERIEIGSKVYIGPQVTVLTGTHHMGPSERRAGDNHNLPVSIRDGSWIGARATIMPGVTVGAGCVVATGAVVTQDCAPNGLYAGVPAVRKRDL